MIGFKETLKELKKVIKSKISIVEMLTNLAKFKKMVGNEEEKIFDASFLSKELGVDVPIVPDKGIQFSDVNEFYEFYIYMMKKAYHMVDNMVRAFDSEKCIGKIDDFSLLFLFLVKSYTLRKIKIFELYKIFGSAVKFNSLKYYKDNKALLELSKYFELDGKFTSYEGRESLMEALKAVVNYEELYETMSDEFFSEMSIHNINSVLMQADICRRVYLDNLVINKSSEKSETVSKRQYVKEKFDASEEIVEKLKFLNAEEKTLYDNCSMNISKISYRSDYGYYLEAIKDLQSLDELYDELDEEEREEIKNEAIDKLRALALLLGSFTSERTNSIIFLPNNKEGFYFSEDILTIDKGLRKKVPALFEKIYNGINTRCVLDSSFKRGEVLFVNDANITMTFCKLSDDTTLVIGLHTIADGLDEDINRYLLNKKTIDNLKDLIKNDLEREKLIKASENLVLKREK